MGIKGCPNKSTSIPVDKQELSRQPNAHSKVFDNLGLK